MNCRYLQMNWRYLQIGLFGDICNSIADIFNSIGDISNSIADMCTSIGDIFNSVNKCENGAPYKTAFRSGTGGLYEFTRMCFGLTGAPATFMRLTDKLFGNLNFQSVLVYMDDILVFGATVGKTLKRLEVVLQRLSLSCKSKDETCQMSNVSPEIVVYWAHSL